MKKSKHLDETMALFKKAELIWRELGNGNELSRTRVN
jgi:hypothetical protein